MKSRASREPRKHQEVLALSGNSPVGERLSSWTVCEAAFSHRGLLHVAHGNSSCSASIPRSHTDLRAQAPLQLCTPRPGGSSQTILHSTHRRLLSLWLQTAACLCLRHPLQGSELWQNFSRTLSERAPTDRGLHSLATSNRLSVPPMAERFGRKQKFLIRHISHLVLGVRKPSR